MHVMKWDGAYWASVRVCRRIWVAIAQTPEEAKARLRTDLRDAGIEIPGEQYELPGTELDLPAVR